MIVMVDAGDTCSATTPAMVAPTACMVSIPALCSPRACPRMSCGVRAIRRSCSNRPAPYPTDATATASTASGMGSRVANSRYGTASSSRSGLISRRRHRAGTNRPNAVSPASIPSAAATNSTPADRGA
jgi:hypothetical protein